jgi:tetraacyldisaccharide 4'-kinase
MRAGWIEERDEGWRRRVALSPLVPFAWLVGGAATLHRALYERGVLGRRQLAARVVSVGNIVAGGTGKTPLAAWVARELHARGRKVVLASRGYGRTGRERVQVVSDGHRVRSRVAVAGDEPVLLAAHAPGVPVLVGRDRGLVGLRALSAFGADVMVLDDGFQHHRLARDLDLVSFDGRLGFGNRRVLPRGPLREPARALRRADAVAVVDGPLAERDEDRVQALAPDAFRIHAQRNPVSLRPLAGGADVELARLEGRDVGLLAGIAQPRSFRRTLERLGANVVVERVFSDHHAYGESDLKHLGREADLWITTEKDAVKIVPWWVGDADVQVLRIGLAVANASSAIDWIETRLA